MKFIFTGTGTSQGVPVIACNCEVCRSPDVRDKRLRSSGLLSSSTTSLVFDTGPDFRQQMLAHAVHRLDAVIFTHQHKDHTAGLDDIRAFNFRQRKRMDIFLNRATLEHLKREYYYIFEANDYPALPQMDLHLIHGQEGFEVGDIRLEPIPVMHHTLPVLGYRAGPFAYITDANVIPPDSMEKLQGVEYLVINALRKEAHRSHFNLAQALEVIRTLGPKKAYLTHISHMMGLHQEIQASLPEGVFMAYDGLTLEW